MRDPASGPVAQVPLWRRLIVGKKPRITLLRAMSLGVVCWLTFRHALLPVRVSGISMEPTIRNGSVNVVNRLAYLWREPRRGEIVTLRTTGTRIMYLKRIIAVPRESVELRAGTVWIDGRPLNEPYLKAAEPWELELRTLGPDEFLVMGDNRTMPRELHWGGVVKRARIVGRAMWPPDERR